MSLRPVAAILGLSLLLGASPSAGAAPGPEEDEALRRAMTAVREGRPRDAYWLLRRSVEAGEAEDGGSFEDGDPGLGGLGREMLADLLAGFREAADIRRDAGGPLLSPADRRRAGGQVRHLSRWTPADEVVAARRESDEPAWISREHLTLWTDVPDPAGEFAPWLAGVLERIRAGQARLLGYAGLGGDDGGPDPLLEPGPIPPPTLVYRVHASRDRYVAEGGPPGTEGTTRLEGERPVVRGLATDLSDRRAALGTLCHETVHALAGPLGDGLPPWFEEGLADHVATDASPDPAGFRAIRVRDDDQAKLLHVALSDDPSPLLPDLLEGGRLDYTAYALAWSLVDVLARTTPDRLARILRRARTGLPFERSTLAPEGLEALEARWRAEVPGLVRRTLERSADGPPGPEALSRPVRRALAILWRASWADPLVAYRVQNHLLFPDERSRLALRRLLGEAVPDGLPELDAVERATLASHDARRLGAAIDARAGRVEEATRAYHELARVYDVMEMDDVRRAAERRARELGLEVP